MLEGGASTAQALAAVVKTLNTCITQLDERIAAAESAHPDSLLFAGLALNRPDYLELWKNLPADSNVEEVIRNFFIRQPVLWVN